MGAVVRCDTGTGPARDGTAADTSDTPVGTPDAGPGEPVAAEPASAPDRGDEEALHVSIEQDLCTGDGLCVQYAPEVFEFDIDGLAYVKDASGELLTDPGARTGVPPHLRLEVLDAARECPGECIHVRRAADGMAVAGPEADA